jgi:hypothetical protein
VAFISHLLSFSSSINQALGIRHQALGVKRKAKTKVDFFFFFVIPAKAGIHSLNQASGIA